MFALQISRDIEIKREREKKNELQMATVVYDNNNKRTTTVTTTTTK